METSEEQDGFNLDEYLESHLPEYDEYVGKHLLVSLTYLDEVGAVSQKLQIHGVITRINEAIIAMERQDTAEEFTIPCDLGALTVAAAGEYRLKPSGEVVVNPDYLTVWTVGQPDPDVTPQTA